MELISEILSNATSSESQILAKLAKVLSAVIGMSGAVTLRSISRVSGLSESSLHRLYDEVIDWDLFRFELISSHLSALLAGSSLDSIVLVMDEVVESKCGKHTAGLGSFYSSLEKQVVSGISNLVLSLVDMRSGKSYVLGVVQLLRNESDAAQTNTRKARKADLAQRKAAAAAQGVEFVPNPVGRRKGTTKEVLAEREAAVQNPHESTTYRHASTLCKKIETTFREMKERKKYLVADSAFGNQHYVRLCKELNWHLVSKLKNNAKLQLPYSGSRDPHQKGAPKKYGDTIDYRQLPQPYLVSSKTDKKQNQQEDTYQFKAYNPTVSKELLNIVVIQRTCLVTGRKTHVVLFSTDLQLGWEELCTYYQHRNDIEIDFRECKQYFGLRDFKNYKQQKVTTAINLAFTAQLVAQLLAIKLQKILHQEKISIWDVVCYCKAELYTKRVIKIDPKFSSVNLLPKHIAAIAQLEAVNIARAG